MAFTSVVARSTCVAISVRGRPSAVAIAATRRNTFTPNTLSRVIVGNV